MLQQPIELLSKNMKLTNLSRFSIVSISILLVSLSIDVGRSEAQLPSSSGCYKVRSLNNNFQSNLRFLGAIKIDLGTPRNSEGASVQMVQYRTVAGLIPQDSRVWKITQTEKGSILTTWSSNGRVNIDGSSDGKTVDLHSYRNVTHGQYWQIEPDKDGFRIRSLNNNFRDRNYRWLDGASDGRTVQLVNGTSHGTLWEIKSIGSCPARL
jgi:hypothetical protein